MRGEVGHDFVEAVRPVEQEIVIDKSGYSAFAHAGLQQVLTKRGIETVLMTGVTTEVCVSSTLRAAIDLGYRCITVADACASGNLDLHKAALAMIAVEGGIFGEIATTAEVVKRFTRCRDQLVADQGLIPDSPNRRGIYTPWQLHGV